jgi:hypothetical protein
MYIFSFGMFDQENSGNPGENPDWVCFDVNSSIELPIQSLYFEDPIVGKSSLNRFKFRNFLSLYTLKCFTSFACIRSVFTPWAWG